MAGGGDLYCHNVAINVYSCSENLFIARQPSVYTTERAQARRCARACVLHVLNGVKQNFLHYKLRSHSDAMCLNSYRLKR